MKNTALKATVAAIVGLSMTGAANAATFGPAGSGPLQGVLDGITVGPVAGSSSVDVTTDEISDGLDSLWTISGSGGSVSTIVIELAGFANANTFGIYDAANPMNQVEIFNGAASSGSQALLSILGDGSVVVNFGDTGVDFAANKFGYYLSTPQNNTWHSDSGLNSDSADHMFAYQGSGDTIEIAPFAAGPWSPNEYALAWEDLAFPGADGDFTDFVVLVESVTPMPEPSILALMGLGLLGFAGRRRMR